MGRPHVNASGAVRVSVAVLAALAVVGGGIGASAPVQVVDIMYTGGRAGSTILIRPRHPAARFDIRIERQFHRATAKDVWVVLSEGNEVLSALGGCVRRTPARVRCPYQGGTRGTMFRIVGTTQSDGLTLYPSGVLGLKRTPFVTEMHLGAGDDAVVVQDAGGGRNLVVGGEGKDSVVTFDGRDRLYGGRGMDVLRAGRGNDVLSGGEGTDAMHGYRGDDVLIAKAGKDYVRGHEGNDFVDAFDPESRPFADVPDDVRCHRGLDTVYANPEDVVSKDCEIVRRYEPSAADYPRGR